MRRSTRNRLLPAAAAVVAIGLAILGVRVLSTPSGTEQTFAGTYTSDTDLRVTNLTIPGGHVTAGYSLDVLYLPGQQGASAGPEPGIRCGLVDTSGRLDLFEPSRTTAAPGGWRQLTFDGNYVLPRMTLGLRCSPNSDGTATVVFRDAELRAVPLP